MLKDSRPGARARTGAAERPRGRPPRSGRPPILRGHGGPGRIAACHPWREGCGQAGRGVRPGHHGRPAPALPAPVRQPWRAHRPGGAAGRRPRDGLRAGGEGQDPADAGPARPAARGHGHRWPGAAGAHLLQQGAVLGAPAHPRPARHVRRARVHLQGPAAACAPGVQAAWRRRRGQGRRVRRRADPGVPGDEGRLHLGYREVRADRAGHPGGGRGPAPAGAARPARPGRARRSAARRPPARGRGAGAHRPGPAEVG